ncbi:short-chain dehydrogenase/reductase SDR [Beutenbergia cavernae DSM 12333]|uniref:Short-chain dehydrogenase/reductase SDR n=1 Tax=Beutenbergia cavernae (strain ATCC BAA-8 / DSM 12333 / CCUG 43141 / JCM 11478 / NBRC 16432 / NCIMB 13614 / HKI 0122) TaxID=471853 RepID=C5BXA4_BEUC1|nr:SDR family NAD(P)-dependent oxidoreductase [Beutenbergia cavernae]ACQ78779.1 short-chain dehydrogenase/reductase SDR [Beutenbergia cavernae DSM 12333]
MSLVLVTGSTRGLGLATARRLAEAGHHVILTGRGAADVEAAVSALRAEGVVVEGHPLDVTDQASVASLVAWVQERHGELDVLVNNAGILPEATATDAVDFASVDLFRTTFETNVFGLVAVTEALLPLLRASGAARIVNVSSTVGSLAAQTDPASPWYEMLVPAYQTSKSAVNALTIQLAKKLAGTDIVVTAVCPGWVQTDLAPGNWEQAPLTADEAAVVVAAAAVAPDGTPSGRFVDAAGTVAW